MGVHHVGTQYEIVPSKTVVGVDRPVNALTCKQKEEKLSVSSHRCHFVKNYFFRNKISSCKCPMGVHHVGTQYEIVPSKIVVGVDRPMNALTCKKKKKCLSSLRCHFVKNYFFCNNISSCKCPMGAHYVGIISKKSKKNCGRS